MEEYKKQTIKFSNVKASFFPPQLKWCTEKPAAGTRRVVSVADDDGDDNVDDNSTFPCDDCDVDKMHSL